MRLLSLLVLMITAQRPAPLKFEVASVKPAAPEHDGPTAYRNGPDRIIFERQSLLRLINVAYGVNFDQIAGPKWISSEYYEVNAKIPSGTSKEDLKLMWQDLLAERFGLKVHFTTKEMPGYELVVAKNGPKFHVEPGFPEPRQPGSKHALSGVPPRNVRQTFHNTSMAEFCQDLAWTVASEYQEWPGYFSVGRVVDKTGLEGNYDFTFEFAGRYQSGAYPQPLPDGQTDTASYFFDALQQQLGLRLTEKKIAVPLLVVDAANKVPTEN
jgi:uncharacterized protein (TIGR03435 family)